MKELTSHAKAAAAIRVELKAAFPGTKFAVHSRSFSMGDDVSISWVDSPPVSEVDAIVGKYQYGHFDGMQDMYEYSNHRNDIPQVKYVMAERGISYQGAKKYAEQWFTKYGYKIIVTEDDSYSGYTAEFADGDAKKFANDQGAWDASTIIRRMAFEDK